jgi:hypothetical protein
MSGTWRRNFALFLCHLTYLLPSNSVCGKLILLQFFTRGISWSAERPLRAQDVRRPGATLKTSTDHVRAGRRLPLHYVGTGMISMTPTSSFRKHISRLWRRWWRLVKLPISGKYQFYFSDKKQYFGVFMTVDQSTIGYWSYPISILPWLTL